MKKRRFIKCISFISAVMLCLSMIMSSFHQKIEAQASQTLSNGTYTIKGFVKNATSDQASMGNAGIVQPMQLLVKDGKYTIRMECQALSTKLGSVNFKGYLAQMGYFPDWDKESQPTNELAEPIKVESYYKGVYDKYNDPQKGTDSTVKGKLYPHYLNLPVDYEKKQIWIQVYVPIMEEINQGSGLQYARLQLDWTTVKKVSDNLPDTDNTGDTKTVDKGGLQYLILSANALLSHENLYTKTTINTLKKSVANAKAVYNDADATQAQVKQQMKALSAAITGLKEKTSSSSKNTTSKTLNIKNLENGTYAVSGKILKTDRKSESMSNEAINHTIKLTVKSGKYYLTLDFKGLNMNSQYGYLKGLKYYASGYKTNSSHVPSGTLKSVTINSYQKDTNGKKIKDDYGSNYPDKVTFPLIKEALSDGYVPLQVFVPVMDAISPGSGKQAVYLKLDLSSVKTAKNNSVFKDSSNTAPASTGSSSGASFETASASDTGFKTEETSNQTQTTGTDQTSSQTAFTTNAVQTEGSSTVQTNDEEEQDSPLVVPSIMSILMSVIGIVYKLKSRGL